MKRMWVGIALLGLLLLLGVFLWCFLGGIFRGISRDMEQAAAAIEQTDWDTAFALTDRAQRSWEKYHHFTASFTDHAPLEQMDSLFSQLPIYARQSLWADYASECTRISCVADAIREVHILTWWNLL